MLVGLRKHLEGPGAISERGTLSQIEEQKTSGTYQDKILQQRF